MHVSVIMSIQIHVYSLFISPYPMYICLHTVYIYIYILDLVNVGHSRSSYFSLWYRQRILYNKNRRKGNLSSSTRKAANSQNIIMNSYRLLYAVVWHISLPILGVVLLCLYVSTNNYLFSVAELFFTLVLLALTSTIGGRVIFIMAPSMLYYLLKLQ
jgi:hypothetical protein